MNALVPIRQLWPGMPSAAVGAPGMAASPTPSIPAAELRELNACDPGLSVSTAQPASSSFAGVLDNLVQGVNAKQTAATQALQDLQSGQNVSLHQAMIAMEEASVSFQLMVEVRNRLLDSYQELMRMQV
jgi:flagellar hook-basal body complex protein FliE